jgi:hypothetical protein
VQLLEAGPRVLASFPPSLSEKAAQQLRNLRRSRSRGSSQRYSGLNNSAMMAPQRTLP